MANVIRVLDDKVINRIAAGEVVERPASVVKELIENSIDAQASAIRLDIEEGGKKSIIVKDNGMGMSHDDAFLALERHATSKLNSEKDLRGIATMGFRGEALASIGSVSRLRLVTSDGSEDGATEIVVEGGTLKKSERVGAGRGTLVEVRNLFYNVPVRRKFLKTRDVESGHIQELVVRLALAFPPVSFVYTEDGQLKMDAPAVTSTLARIHTLYSRDVRENLIQVKSAKGDSQLSGYVAKPPYARSNMRSVLTFVNGRSVRDRLLNAAVMKAFAHLMERGRYPLAVLFLEIPPDEVDVNVHPQKAEVRFAKSKEIFDLILEGVHEALVGAPFNRTGLQKETRLLQSAVTPLNQHVFKDDREKRKGASSDLTGGQGDDLERVTAQTEVFPSEGFSALGILGQLPHSFLVLYGVDDLVIIDQHAAHERVLFDHLLQTVLAGEPVESQDLLLPNILHYSPVEARLMAAHLGLLQKIGFRIEEFGDNDFVVKGVPVWLKNQDLEAFFAGLVEIMLDTGLAGDTDRMREELLKTVACRGAVKESTPMRSEEIGSLLKALDKSNFSEVCPHGRPLAVRYTFNEIRKKMGRR